MRVTISSAACRTPPSTTTSASSSASLAKRVQGRVAIPGDKSISHRTLLFGALAHGTCSISNVGPGADVRSTAACLGALGVDVKLEGTDAIIHGQGLASFKTPAAPLDCGNSGTTMRLLSGILASASIHATLDGDAGLRRRPMRRVLAPLRAMGADAKGVINDDNSKELAPLSFSPSSLVGCDHDLALASAQVKSAILLAGLHAGGRTRVREPHQSRDHTERMLADMGVEVGHDDGWLWVQRATSPLQVPANIRVPGDPSSAAFLLAAAAVVDDADLHLEFVSANRTRTGFLRAMRDMGLQVAATPEGKSAGDPVESLHVTTSGPLKAINITAKDVPALVDEIPVLAVVATQANGTTTISGAEDLRHKESDRLATTAAFLRTLGASIEEKPDGLVITGPTPLHGGVIDTHGDHRIALAGAVAGLCASGPVTINDAEWADVSWPGFFTTLREISGGGVDVTP